MCERLNPLRFLHFSRHGAAGSWTVRVGLHDLEGSVT